MMRQSRRQSGPSPSPSMPLCLVLLLSSLLLLASLCSAKHHHPPGFKDKWPGWEGADHRKRKTEDSSPKTVDVTTTEAPSPSPSLYHDGRNVLLHEAVRKLLGFEASPTEGGSGSHGHGHGHHKRLLRDPRDPPPMPKYVLDLYEKYRSGEMQGGPALGNTVRSIPAEIGEVNGQAMFIFNLSSISTTERVLRAHVHLFKRKSPTLNKHKRRARSQRQQETELVLYEVAPHYLSQMGSIIMRDSARGWQLYGATEAVMSCLLADRAHPHLFALSFRAARSNGKMKTLALKRFVRHHSLPFLILYSNETASVNLEELNIVAERLKQSDHEDEDDDATVLQEAEKAPKRDDKYDISDDFGEDKEKKVGDPIGMGGDHILDLFHGFGQKRHREKQRKTNMKKKKYIKRKKDRKIASKKTVAAKITLKKDDSSAPLAKDADTRNNSLQQSDKTTRDSNELQKLELRDSAAESGDDSLVIERRKRSILTNEIPEDPADYSKVHYRFNLPQTHPGMLTARKDYRHRLEPSRLIPYPLERTAEAKKKKKSQRRRRKHRKRKNRRRNRKGRRRMLLPEQWEDYHDNLATPDNNPGQVCARRRLVVDFADIGWGDWIISPKSFEAHYCSGTCPFPLTKKLRPSNHATIQSIVNAIGLYQHVPAPCCVPDTMTSVTLLYFDENRNVVLKNYPGMSVQSCACR